MVLIQPVHINIANVGPWRAFKKLGQQVGQRFLGIGFGVNFDAPIAQLYGVRQVPTK